LATLIKNHFISTFDHLIVLKISIFNFVQNLQSPPLTFRVLSVNLSRVKHFLT